MSSLKVNIEDFLRYLFPGIVFTSFFLWFYYKIAYNNPTEHQKLFSVIDHNFAYVLLLYVTFSIIIGYLIYSIHRSIFHWIILYDLTWIVYPEEIKQSTTDSGYFGKAFSEHILLIFVYFLFLLLAISIFIYYPSFKWWSLFFIPFNLLIFGIRKFINKVSNIILKLFHIKSVIDNLSINLSKIGHVIYENDLKKWFEKSEDLSKLSNWRAQIHFLYCLSEAIIFSIIILRIITYLYRVNLSDEFWNTVFYFTIFAINLFFFNIIYDLKYNNYERNIIKKNNQQAEKNRESVS